MSVKSIGFKAVTAAAGDYDLPQIRLSKSNQILQIAEDTDIANLGTNITKLTQQAVALEALINTLNDNIEVLDTDIQAANADVETQETQLQSISSSLASISALLSIIEPKVSVRAGIKSRAKDFESAVFQPNLDGAYGIFQTVDTPGYLSYSTTGEGVSPFVVGGNVKLTFSPVTGASNASSDYLKNGGKIAFSIFQGVPGVVGSLVYQSKQGMFNFNTDNVDNVSFAATDVILLPRGTYTYTFLFFCSTQNLTPEATGQPDVFAQTSWQVGSYYDETDIKTTTGFTAQFEAIMVSL